MNNETILLQAIDKAIKNGYIENYWTLDNYYGLIFSHDFAKAFWKDGTQEYLKNPKDGTVFPGRTFTWEYHLQQMVLEEDPIKYLEQWL